jgi:hypothetical protein
MAKDLGLSSKFFVKYEHKEDLIKNWETLAKGSGANKIKPLQ